MANWKEEYMVSLKGAEMNNPVNMELVQTCMSAQFLDSRHGHKQTNSKLRLPNG